MDNKIVEILSGIPGERGRYLSRVYDKNTGTYFGPVLSESERLSTMVDPNKNLNHRNIRIAVIDSGMLHAHPLIKPYLVERDSRDFTEEGLEDFNGHGTMVSTILALRSGPGLEILNVKAIDAEGRGTPENLVKAIKWSVEHGAKIINMSVGIYRKKWGLLECKGDCNVCQAAEHTGKNNVIVCAAAGNEGGKTYCPAKVGILKEHSSVIAVSATLLDGTLSPTSGYGNIAARGEFWFGPIRPSATDQ